MVDILNEVVAHLPEDAKISSCNFEAANIIVYTKNKDFFLDPGNSIREVVNIIKKRIELRPDPSLCKDIEISKEKIEALIPKEADINEIFFDSYRSQVVIEAEKPGLAIGKAGEILKEIKKQTMWVPLVKRSPSIKSKIIHNIRQVLYENSEFRRKFLDRVGKRIYSGWVRGKKDEWVRITCMGASRQVGRSCFLLQTPESRVMLDCGINPAAQGNDMFPMFDVPEFKINELDAVIISHAHLDHSAMAPLLFKYGYDGPIYCTEPTRDVMALLQLDYISLGQKELKSPLYTSTEVKEMVKRTICINYEEVTDITPDMRLTFYNAGHTIGSCMAHLHIGNGLHNFLYTGDMNYENSNLLASATTIFPRLESIMVEGTYGGKDDNPPPRRECEKMLMDIIHKTVERGGKVLLPVLGVGRSQEVMIMLERAMREGTMPNVKIYVQGLVWDITAVHTAYPEYFNAKIKKSIFHQNANPFVSDVFKQIAGQKEMQMVIESGEPCVILATSGMMTGGASVEYFKGLAENPKHSIVLTCYQPEGCLGRRMMNGEREFSFSKGEGRSEVLRVNMEVYSIHGFTGHSTRAQLLNFFYHLEPKPKKIMIVHGEVSKCLDLASTLHKIHKIETIAPRALDAIRLR